MAKKSKIDVGKGFKRIYFLASAVWVAVMFFIFLAEFFACQVHKMDNIMCMNFNAAYHWFNFAVVAGLVVPLYYFLVWIAQGFKK